MERSRNKKFTVITDLQFGSTGKGLFAGYLALKNEPDTVITAWGPNSGHTFMGEGFGKMVNIALPNGIISPKLKRVLIGPGSVINPMLLLTEMDLYIKHLHGADILIHENAAIVTEEHRQLETESTLGIGSTMKGVGEAIIQKIRRNRAKMNNARTMLVGTPLEGLVVSIEEYNAALDSGRSIQLEGSQGYSLSINHGFYPYTTSRDCTKWQMFTDCGVPGNLGIYPEVYGVARTYPIRVANRERNGEQVGWSGPCYPDQHEIAWKDINVEPELTTVTRLPRRIFTFSMTQIRQAVRANGVDAIFLNFCNYDQSANFADGGFADVAGLVRQIGDFAPVAWTGWGPDLSGIKEQ